MQDTIYTIGYEGAALDDVIAKLRQARIGALIDVRAAPLSRKPGFSKDALSAAVEKNGIAYHGFTALGTPSEGRAAAKHGNAARFHDILTAQLDSAAGQSQMARAIDIARTMPACLLCFEHDARHCHRMIVAERMARETGQKIEHLVPVHGFLL